MVNNRSLTFVGRTRQRGAVTMIGAFLVITIFTLILAAYMGYVRLAEQASQAQTFASAVLDANTRIQNHYATNFQTGYTGLTAPVAADLGLLPSSLEASLPATGTLGRTPWGGTWRLNPYAGGAVNGIPIMYRMILVGLPSRVCVSLSHALIDDAEILLLSGFQVKPGPTSGGAVDLLIANQCSSGTESSRSLNAYYN